MTEICNPADYRAFRARVLQQISNERRQNPRPFNFDNTERNSFGTGRLTIAAFRAEVAERASEMLAESAEALQFVQRALGLDVSMSLVPSRWQVAGQIGLFFLPDLLLMRRARNLLGRACTFEGRRYLFRHFIHRTLPDQKFYDEELDFALRNFAPIRSVQDLKHLQRQSRGILKVAHLLGLHSVDDVRSAFSLPSELPAGSLLLLLVQEGAIQSVEELPWALNRESRSYQPQPEADELRQARATVRCLMMHGIERQLVAGLFQFLLGGLAPGRLAANLALLRDANEGDLSRIFKRVGDLLWRAPSSSWQFVLETIGAQTVEAIVRFRPLLESHRELSVEFTRELFTLGATLDDIAACQQLLLAVSRESSDVPFAIDGLRRLASAPHALRFDQIAQCSAYLTGQRDLNAFLQVLTDHGYGGADAVLAFQKCYGGTSGPVIHRLLAILGDRGRGEPLEFVATWTQQAGQGGYFDGLEYLVSAVDTPGLVALQQALKLVPLGKPFLRYAVEDRGLRSLNAIRNWYYHDANGIDGYRSWGAFDALDKVLLDDAWVRRQFNQLDGNTRCVAHLIGDRVTSVLGRFPWEANDAEKSTYRRTQNSVEREGRVVLLPILPEILQRTGGTLLPSLFEGMWTGRINIEAQLARLSPLLADLLEGRGPIDSHLVSLDAEAIALVYHTTPHTVSSQWSQVVAQEQDTAELKLRSHYPMAWMQARWQIHRPLDRRGFLALVKAGKFAGHFSRGSSFDMFTACRHLSPKQLTERSKDIGTLALHLGSLLAVAREDEVVARWSNQGFEELMLIDEESLVAYQRMGDLVTLLDVVLPDALDAHTERCIQSLSDDDAAHWASRLGEVDDAADVATKGRVQLRANLARVRATVLPQYLAWAQRQRRKFGKVGSAHHTSQPLLAVVSKHPAAFFAKAAVNLCTAGNVEMWREKRLLHLLVFDRAGQRLAGMALLYVELVPALDPMRPSLLIRALNPTNDMLAGHDIESIIASFFDVAIQIAHDNGLACVAFPSPTGMHLMSNHRPIEAHLEKRYIKRASSVWQDATSESNALLSRDIPQCVRAEFYAYEHGKERVNELYVIWRALSTDNFDERV